MDPFYFYKATGGKLADLAKAAQVSASYLRDLQANATRMPSLDTGGRIQAASNGLVPISVWSARRDLATRTPTPKPECA